MPRRKGPAVCHPDRPNYSGGRCGTCYRRKKFKGTSLPEVSDMKLRPKIDGRLNLEDLTRDVAIYGDMPIKTARKVVFTIFGLMIRELKKEESVLLMGFGTFKPVVQAGRRRFDVKNGAGLVYYPPKIKVKFIPAKQLNYMVNPESFST